MTNNLLQNTFAAHSLSQMGGLCNAFVKNKPGQAVDFGKKRWYNGFAVCIKQ